MSKIKLYNIDTVIHNDDKVIGTDFSGSVTKNYLMEDILGYMQENIEDIEVVGLQGPQGDPGPKGDPGAVGPAGLEWKGAWVSGNNYVADDAVSYNGASYFCISDVTGGTTAPDTDTTHWALLAAQGAAGDPGARGPRGYGIASSLGSFYDSLGNPITTPNDDSEYKVKLTFEDGTILTTGDLRGPKGDAGDVVGTGTVTSVGVDTNTPLAIASSGSNPITSSGTITMSQATSVNDGYLSSTDFSSFNTRIRGSSSASASTTSPTEIKVMLTSEYSDPSFTPEDDIIYVLV